MSQEGVMGQRRMFSAEYQRETVAMFESPGVTVHQIATELGIGATVLGRWRREENLAPLRLELARMTKERDFFEKRQRSSRERREEVSDDPTMPHRVSHPDDVPVFAGLIEWALWLGDPPAE
jgi:transposase